jgi:hypothetical protein
VEGDSLTFTFAVHNPRTKQRLFHEVSLNRSSE